LSNPSVVIIGRPNVGKSTLFNRICRQQRALVGNEPGMTRDRIYASAKWKGQQFELIDTGGMIPGSQELISRSIFQQAERVIRTARIMVLVVDGRVGLTPLDRSLAKLLIKGGKSVIVAVNKCDTTKYWINAQEFYELGFAEVMPLSAAHGINIGELLDSICKHFPADTVPTQLPAEEIRIAIVGKPNVGKSTLLNNISGTDRVIVSPIPGTTRDAIDSLTTRKGQAYRFIDTAGIRRKQQTLLKAEKLSVMIARRSLARADVALVMMDATDGPSSLDAAIAGYSHEAGISTILVVNKWDLVSKNTHTLPVFEKKVRAKLRFLDYAPIVFMSATTGQRVSKLFPIINQVFRARRTRVGTGELNAFLHHVALHKAAVPFNRQVKVHYMTQVHNSPPTFVLFTNRRSPLHFSIERYLINRIRERFEFIGTPIVLKQKLERKAG